MAEVVIVAPDYDPPTSRTLLWARDLHRQLNVGAHRTIFLAGPEASASRFVLELAAAQPRLSHVIFYGHGDRHSLYGQPLGAGLQPASIVDSRQVHILDSTNLYAVACFALDGLGDAFAQRNNPRHHFVGYLEDFAFSYHDVDPFRDLVNTCAVRYVCGLLTGAGCATALREGWTRLKVQYERGQRKTTDYVLAAFAADINANGVNAK